MAEKRIVRVGLVQRKVSDDLAANLQDALSGARQAAGAGAKIICLQELYRSPYFARVKKMDAAPFAETIPGESTDAFSALAKETGAVIIVPLYERDGGSFFNSAAVIDADGSLLGAYRKIHIPQDEYYFEKNYFEPGGRGFMVFRTQYADIAALICYDQWFPEAARIAALSGAEIVFYPTAIGHIIGEKAPEGDWHDAWRTVQRGHAIANSVNVCAVNRAGIEGELKFWGGSFVCDAFGKVIAEACDGNEVITADLDLSLNSFVREGWGFFRNRRPETYRKITE